MAARYEIIAKSMSIVNRCGNTFKLNRLKEHGLGVGQLRYITTLYHHGGLSQDTIVKRFMVDKANVARHIQRLEDLGMIRREVDQTDKRKHLIYLTEKGQEVQPIIEETMKAWSGILTDGFTEEEREQLVHLLVRMAENAQNFQEEVSGDEGTE
ncbi:MarR family winged helix-turn-helix transcriptional regulator [Listeria booriae]|uniref:MarR family winged helix-turn-helix transcriptional regulator n=1 Tax=Listeria booriae TaxID=1552123 RepID=UPI0016239AD4|nr:MarR family transcriptional regulator [Listeria booriae]MBC1985379.1 MarR family transcriptional regulator [Listeria booriae]MBC2322028.1 MarR family transcriptional regulator [Listeria booriae]MCD2205457.1 MarR family transcriptional regulator [Listeria booriae]